MKILVLKLIRIYQALPLPSVHASCRHLPTCSQYTYEAIYKYGIVKGIILGLNRIAKCNPFASPKIDPLT